jgi:hypothetical protein
LLQSAQRLDNEFSVFFDNLAVAIKLLRVMRVTRKMLNHDLSSLT